MLSIKREFDTREEEIRNCIGFIHKMENDSFSILNTEVNTDASVGSIELSVDTIALRTSIKAGIVLMLYNLVEATMTMSLSKIHETFRTREVKFEDLNYDLKKMIVVYYSYIFEKKNDIHSSFDKVIELVGHLKGEAYFDTTYKDLSDYYPLYSGNLDGKEIRNVLSKYGITVSTRISELQNIKNLRNTLAHGEKSFEEVGRDLSLQQLTAYFNKTIAYLNEIMEEVQRYLQEESYKQSTNNI